MNLKKINMMFAAAVLALFAPVTSVIAQSQNLSDMFGLNEMMDKTHGYLEQSYQGIPANADKADKMLELGQENMQKTIDKISDMVKKVQMEIDANNRLDNSEKDGARKKPHDKSDKYTFKPYQAEQAKMPSVFRMDIPNLDDWGKMPTSAKNRILEGSRFLDAFPDKYREWIFEYLKSGN